ncbi:MAG: zinc-dependent peptidase [Capsulimonadales bacterium]|nr:zinc-dependent peptidase [Capsulimonadales bacterium]
MFHWFHDLRRKQILARPFPPEWEAYIDSDLPHWRCLSPEERRHLRDHIRVFVAEKHWEGAGGLELTDRIKVTIAANACLLLLGLPQHDFYPNVQVIIVYPWAYWSRLERPGEGGVVHAGISGRLGEAWSTGQVILSWNTVRRNIRRPEDGHNVVLHEFAHLLDMRDGRADGVPRLANQAEYDEWAEIMAAEFQRLRLGVIEGWVDVLDGYGATDPAEFFAVATECFFELPIELKERHPALYGLFTRYYGQDTAARAEACRLTDDRFSESTIDGL